MKRWRVVCGAVLAGLAVQVTVGIVGIAAADAVYTRREATVPLVPEVVEHAAMDPAKLTAVVVMGNEGANAADVLAPYEVLVATGAFNVWSDDEQDRTAKFL